MTDAELDYIQSAENLVHDAVPMTVDDLIKVSVARCARVSYKTHDGTPTSVEADMALYERLLGSVPLHASPAEHQAKMRHTMSKGFLISLGLGIIQKPVQETFDGRLDSIP